MRRRAVRRALRAAGCLALLSTALAAGAARAADPRLYVGAHLSVDILTAEAYANQSATAAGDLFVRWAAGRNVALEASVGYRRSSASETRNGVSNGFTLKQVPVSVGAAWLFFAGQEFRPWIGAGAVVAPSESTATAAVFPSPETTRSISETVLGGYGELGARLPLVDRLLLDVRARWVYNPVPSSMAAPAAQDYLWGSVGLTMGW